MSDIGQKVGIIASLVVVIGGTLTFLMTWQNVGFSDDFITAWLSSLALCVLCIAPIGGVIAFLINRAITAMLPTLSESLTNIVFGLVMAVIMESIMAVVTTINLHGLAVLGDLGGVWFSTFITALPVGIVFSIIISLIVKPRLAAFWAN